MFEDESILNLPVRDDLEDKPKLKLREWRYLGEGPINSWTDFDWEQFLLMQQEDKAGFEALSEEVRAKYGESIAAE